MSYRGINYFPRYGKLLSTDLVSGCCEAWGRACPSVDIAVTGPIWRTMNRLDAANATTLLSDDPAAHVSSDYGEGW